MSWTIKTVNDYLVATETVTLGTGITGAARYTSEIDFIPPGTDFVVISNTAATNLSGSCSDQLYCAYESGGTFYNVLGTLRDGNYADDTNKGTSFRSLDALARRRYIDVSYIGEAPYWKLRVLQAGAEKSNRTVTFAIMFPNKGSKSRVHD